MVYIDDHINDFDLQAALAVISPQRREQALQFKFEQGQRTCVLAYLLLKKALLEEYGLHMNPLFEYGEHGKPFIVGHPEIHFNLSHCREAAACIVDRSPVGIDVECIDRLDVDVVAMTMNEREQEEIAASPQPEVEFTRLWTMKESLFKLTGKYQDDIRSMLANAADYHFHTTIYPRFICTVCSP